MQELLHSFTKLEFDKVKKAIARYTISELGLEHVQALEPSDSTAEIKRNISLVTEMKSLLENDDPLPIDSIPDVRESLARSSIESYVLASADLRAIGMIAQTGQNVQSYFIRRKSIYPLFTDEVSTIVSNKILVFNITRAIDEEGNVKDSASKELASIRRQIIDKNGSLRKRLESILQRVSDKEWAQEDIITARDGRMVIPIKTEHKNQVPGFIHSSSSSGATVFIEPTETLELNNDIRTLQFQEQREVEKILRELTEQVRESKASLQEIQQILGRIDFIQAKAKYSIEIIGSHPVIKDAGTLKLDSAYHPILLQRHKRNQIVPLSLEIGNETKTLIITGPNAGGKSVVMKTVGLLTLMAQSACHIPASAESEIPIYSSIFVDMGDEQSIENDLSSFSSHLQNLKFILEHANDSSLVLIDEICSGTDPKEGASIAAAILHNLTEMNSTTIATTHHGELKAFAHSALHFQNGAMEFNLDTFQPTYRFKPGIPGSSYAIEMAERMNFPEDVLKLSKSMRGEKENKLETIILEFERQSIELHKKLEETESQKQSLNSSIKDYENKLTSFKTEVNILKAQAVTDAKAIVQKAKGTIEEAVKSIREASASQESVRNAKKVIADLTKEIRSSEIALHQKPRIIKEAYNIGEHVKLVESGAAGEILSKVDSQHYQVVVGSMKIKTHISNLEPVVPSAVINTNSYYQINETNAIKEIDLRGMLGDEAITSVDKFIDQAILKGLHRIDLIHGKGTGALRKKINEYLKNNVNVKSYRLGEWNEGGAGVTVVELN